MVEKKFSIDKKSYLDYLLKEGVFEPNLTSQLLASSIVSDIINKNKNFDILDLGCGCGIVGISVFKILDNKNNKLFFSDISESAISNTKANLIKHSLDAKVKKGSSFNPWSNQKFDLIIDDISAVSDKVANMSTWFKDISCDSGIDGSDLTLEILNKSDRFMNENSVLYFPILSLSNSNKILRIAKKKYKKIELLISKKWPLPKDMYKYYNELNLFKDKGYINFEILNGLIICETSVYKCIK